jgi:small subunit ribosomal protein S8
MITDPIADYLTRIRNAIKARHGIVEIPASNTKKEITKVLHEKGYIRHYKFDDQALSKLPLNIALVLKNPLS